MARKTQRLLVLLATLSAACAGPEPASQAAAVPIDTVGGVAIVHNGSEGLWGEGEGWSVEEEYRLGGMNAPVEESFGNVLTALSLGPQGSLYVLDTSRGQVSVFSPDGQFRFSFGREGEGPGEFSRAAAMGWDPSGRLWITNALEVRLSVFDSLGTVLTTAFSPGLRPLNRTVYRLHIDPDGTLVDQHSASPLLHLVRRDTTAAIIDTVATLHYPPSVAPGTAIGLAPDQRSALGRLLPRFYWTVGPDGAIWEGITNQSSFAARGPSGDTVRIVHTSHRSPVFSPEDERAAEQAAGIVQDIELRPHHYQAIHVLDDGHLLVQVPSDGLEPGNVMDVFDPEGRFLGSMELPFAPHPRAEHVFRGDTLFAVTLDELDTPEIIKAVIRR